MDSFHHSDTCKSEDISILGVHKFSSSMKDVCDVITCSCNI